MLTVGCLRMTSRGVRNGIKETKAFGVERSTIVATEVQKLLEANGMSVS